MADDKKNIPEAVPPAETPAPTVENVAVPDEALTDEDEDILNYDDLDDPDAFI